MEDDDWRLLTKGVHLLSHAAGLQIGDQDDRGRDEHLEIKPILQWSDGTVAISDVIQALSESPKGSTVVVENAHLLYFGGHPSTALAELRNRAAEAGSFLYLGFGLSHWPDVRKQGSGDLFLTDLPEAYAELVNVADKISMLSQGADGVTATIFDPRYAELWRGPLALKQAPQ